jgi:hypothetical protein
MVVVIPPPIIPAAAGHHHHISWMRRLILAHHITTAAAAHHSHHHWRRRVVTTTAAVHHSKLVSTHHHAHLIVRRRGRTSPPAAIGRRRGVGQRLGAAVPALCCTAIAATTAVQTCGKYNRDSKRKKLVRVPVPMRFDNILLIVAPKLNSGPIYNGFGQEQRSENKIFATGKT